MTDLVLPLHTLSQETEKNQEIAHREGPIRRHLSTNVKWEMVMKWIRGKLLDEKVCYSLKSLKSIKMKDKIDPANLLFCDLETGVCEVAETTSERRMNDAVPSFVDLSDAKVVDKSSNNEPGRNADT